MFKNIESVDMVSLPNYSVHVVQVDACLCFAEISEYELHKMI